jgi:thiamine-monophosphate kinase
LEDDVAVLEIGGETLIITHDMMAEGTHYLPDQDMADVAWKLVAVNLSDLAAKGTKPIGVLLGHTLGHDDDRFLEGLKEVLDEYDVPLLGGDTISAKGARSHGLTAIGKATYTPVPSRAGAKAGDSIYLCGKIGEAMLEFEALRDGTPANSTAYRRPKPLITQGQALAPLVNAMMDISDGLLLDAQRMANASNCTFALDTSAIVKSAPEGRLEDAMRWGDDYALLLTATPDTKLPAEAIRIGEVIPSTDSPLLLDGVRPASPENLGYQHSNP